MLPSSRQPCILGTYLGNDPANRIRLMPANEPIPPTRPGKDIGLVIFATHRGERAEAILDGEGRWHCPQLPVLDRVLNILFDPEREAPGASPFGHESLARVATWLGGAVRVDSSGRGLPPGWGR